MNRVKNRKVIRNIALKSFKASKLRNLIATIAIALTTVLFTCLFTIGIGMVESIQDQTMRQSGSSAHGSFKNLSRQQFEDIAKHPMAKNLTVNMLCAVDVKNPEFLKRRVEFWYCDDTSLEWSFLQLIAGRKPQTADEIMMDTKSIEMMGLPLQLGQNIALDLELSPGGAPVTRSFTLTGYFEPDLNSVGFAYVAKTYLETYAQDFDYTYPQDFNLVGAIRADIKFDKPINIESNLRKIVQESGYSNDENAPNFLASNPNWAYLGSNSLDFSTVLGMVGGLLLIMCTGYLIIFNVFQISVQRDIRFYGLLKTIGTTSKQIKRIVTGQALLLSGLGIPIGLIVGVLIGAAVLPMIMALSYHEAGGLVTLNPWIFAGATIFALSTVFVSTRKPCNIAALVSPVEAVRFTGNHEVRKKTKRSLDGGKVHKMAFSNLKRSQKRTMITIISLSLSLVLLNTVFTISQGFDMDKYLSKFVDTDFLTAHAQYARYKYSGAENAMSESMIQAIQGQEGFEEGGRIYCNPDKEFFRIEDPKNPGTDNPDQHGNFFTILYGMEALPLHRLRVLEGEIDFEKLATGEYILLGVVLDDNDQPIMQTAPFDIGSKVTMHNYKGESEALEERAYTTKTFTVMAKVAIKHFTGSIRRSFGDYNFYLPADVYQTLFAQPSVMSYVFNVQDDAQKQFGEFLQTYTETVEPTMLYESKDVYKKEFTALQTMLLTVGGALSAITALIGVLNFTNSILTGIITRRQEFAILQSIGMTQKQLVQMLMLEGVYYALLTIVVSFVLSIAFSYGIVSTVVGGIWFFSYKFTVLPLLVTYPILLLLAILIPYLAYHTTQKQSIVERLRETE